MKKIMFNDKYGLTKAVLEGRKTQTRRILHCPKTFGGKYVSGFRLCTNKEGLQFAYLVDEDEHEIEGSVNILSAYKVGEEVAVAQSYFETVVLHDGSFLGMGQTSRLLAHAGAKNKMFVLADLMPHRIKITNVRVERLQDISEEDCLKEGVIEDLKGVQYSYPTNIGYCGQYPFDTPKSAFAALINKICGKGTWESNPWVFVYDFELVK